MAESYRKDYAFLASDAQARARAAGMDGFLRKPVSGAELDAAIRATLAREPQAALAS